MTAIEASAEDLAQAFPNSTPLALALRVADVIETEGGDGDAAYKIALEAVRKARARPALARPSLRLAVKDGECVANLDPVDMRQVPATDQPQASAPATDLAAKSSETDFILQAVEFAHAAREAGRNDLASAALRASNGMDVPAATALPPVDLWQRHQAPDLPVGVLPAVIERFAIGQGEVMGADPVGLAMSALAVCAAAINDDIVVQVKRHDPTWCEAARLWVGLVGMPSTKKTPIMSAAVRPLRRIDKALMTEYALATHAYTSLPKSEREATQPPPQRRHIVEDATVEALQEVLKDSPGGVISVQDELSGWFGAMDKYSPGKGAAADRAFWLRAFNGGAYNLNRVVRGVSVIPNLSIGLLGGIQPEPLRKIAGDSVDDGLIQRFLPVILQPASAGRDTPVGDVVKEYDALIDRLSRLLTPSGAGNLSGPAPIRFNNEALVIRERLERENIALVEALETVSPKLAAHFGKHDGIFARLCLLWHCIESQGTTPGPEISDNVASRVARFVTDFLRPSAIAFYSGMLGMSAGHEELMGLAAYIVSEGLDEIGAREVQRSTRALRHFTADEARRICERLEAFGWLNPIDPRQKSSSPRWRVAGAVHAMFAERGRRESERRTAGREAIHAALGIAAS